MSELNSLNSNIKSMKLYRHVDRVLTELQYLGKSEQGPLSADELSPFDQLHYHGTESVDHAVRATGINANSLVLEIGSGLGGPARHIAATVGAKVTALELQNDQNELASHLSARCDLAEKVAHVCGDFLTHEWSTQHFLPFISTQADTSSLCLKLVLPTSQQVRPDIQPPRRLFNLVTLLGYERHCFSLEFLCVRPSCSRFACHLSPRCGS